jgi:RNA recognition motif-containing protein
MAHNTLYIRNLNESVKLPVLKQDLQTTFSQFGKVLDVIAHKNIRMRGQAFVVFEDQEAAKAAQHGVQGFKYHDKEMQVQFAKTPSYVTVKRERGDEGYEEFKKRRLEEKGSSSSPDCVYADVYVERKKESLAAKAQTAQQQQQQQQQQAAPVRKPRPVQPAIPSHHLPPNKVLFLQNLPDSATKEQLVQIYSQFEGFREVRMVPGRKGIAFVEYDMEGQAGMARVNTLKLVMDGSQVSVTFQRKIN